MTYPLIIFLVLFYLLPFPSIADQSFVEKNGDFCHLKIKKDDGKIRNGSWLDLAKLSKIDEKYLPDQYSILRALGYKRELFEGRSAEQIRFRKERLCMLYSESLSQILDETSGRSVVGNCEHLREVSSKINHKVFHKYDVEPVVSSGSGVGSNH